ncbi:IS630 family transposase [Shewanella sp. YLB-09]|uniref:IS630 family transposase n=1 Tax=Shewanella TaxID=22 RepID=UPI00115EED44|nr:IS630 family transposase [Shewanella sp. YLB-09]
MVTINNLYLALKNYTAEEILALSRAEKDPRKRIRLLAVSLFLEGHNRTEVTKRLKVARASVNAWVSKYLTYGLKGLDAKRNKGRDSYLTTKQKQQLIEYIEAQSMRTSGGRLTGDAILKYIQLQFNVDYHPNAIYKLLDTLNFSWITSRSMHPKQSAEAQMAFKKFQLETILNIPGSVGLDRVDIWFQDEARFGQQNSTTRLWARKGTRPRAVRQQQFEYVHFFGAVCPETGETEAIIAPYLSKDIMRQHLSLIAKRTKPGRHAVVVMDGAGWHTNDIADEFINLSIIKLPPYSPELNPVEQVWSWLRQRHLANRSFKGYEDIVDACSIAWNSFISDTKRVMSLCRRDWARMTKY